MDSLRLPVLLLICTVRVVSLDKEIPAPEGERIESCAAGKISQVTLKLYCNISDRQSDYSENLEKYKFNLSDYTQNQFFNAQLRKNNIFP